MLQRLDSVQRLAKVGDRPLYLRLKKMERLYQQNERLESLGTQPQRLGQSLRVVGR